jgi:hypothetical protein
MVILSWVAWGVGTINYGSWDVQLVSGQTYKTIIVFTTIDMSCIIKKIFSPLASKSWHVYSLLIFSSHLFKKRRKKEGKKEKVLNYTSTCMHNIHSTFICSYTLWFIVKHLCSEQEVLIDISFAYSCSLKFESSTLCTNTCYIQLSNKLQSPCLVLSPSYSRTSMS